jgi:fructose-bisphosphate aldolase class II
MQSNLRFLRDVAEPANKWDPPSLFRAVRQDLVDMTIALARKFGSAGKAS